MLEPEFERDFAELATGNEAPVLHQTAMREDKVLLFVRILEQDEHSDVLTKLKVKDRDGLTVLQLACKVDHVEAIDKIVRMLTEEELTDRIVEHSEEGETALHIAASANNPAALHALLKAVKQRDQRKMVFEAKNQTGEDVLRLAGRLDNQKMVKVLEYHQTIMSHKFRDFFTKMEHSLFAIDLSDEQLYALYKRLEVRSIGDIGFARKAPYDATVCLRSGDMGKAKVLVDQCCTVNKDNIHTWCNKGVYILKHDPSQTEEMEHAAFRILDLISGPTEQPQLQAKMNFAYWKAEAIRSDAAREEGCSILRKCLDERLDTEMREYCSYLYVKLLVRHMRSDYRHDKPDEWIDYKLREATEQLIVLHKSKNLEYLGDMWLWLAELQSSNLRKRCLTKCLSKFSQETDELAVDRESCVNHAFDVANHVKQDKKYVVRIAKNCLHCGYDSNSSEDKAHWFRKALTLTTTWQEENYWIFMCSSTSAKALIELWVINYYGNHRDMIDEKFASYRGRPAETRKEVWIFLREVFYTSELATDRCTLQYLLPAERYLARLVEQPEGWISHGTRYARIKYMLGHPEEEVKDAFRKSAYHTINDVSRTKVYQAFGIFYLTTQRFEHAKLLFNLAEHECRDTEYKPLMARFGLKHIEARKYGR